MVRLRLWLRNKALAFYMQGLGLISSILGPKINNKTIMKYHLTLFKVIIIKTMKSNQCWQGCDKSGTLMHCCGIVNQCSYYGKEHKGSSKLKIEISHDPAGPCGHISKGNELSGLKRHLPSGGHCCTIHSSQDMNQPKCLPVENGQRQQGADTQGSTSYLNKGENPVATWMRLEDTMLSEIR